MDMYSRKLNNEEHIQGIHNAESEIQLISVEEITEGINQLKLENHQNKPT